MVIMVETLLKVLVLELMVVAVVIRISLAAL